MVVHIKMLRIGLTGGIGSGKSTVCQHFADLGVPIISADAINRTLLEEDEDLQRRIVEHFGGSILQTDGKIDKQHLRQRVFQDEAARQWLNQLCHPKIRTVINEKIATIQAPYVIVEIPLLIENQPIPYIDRILVVQARVKQQIERIQARDQLTPAFIQTIIARQATSEERLSAADDIISNEGSRQALAEQVRIHHDKYRQLAQLQRP